MNPPEFVGVSDVPFPVDFLLKAAVAPRHTSKRFCCAKIKEVKKNIETSRIPAFFPIKCPHIHSKQPDRLSLINRRYSTQLRQHVFRHSFVDVYDRNRLTRAGGFAAHSAPKRKIGDIDLVLA